MYLYLYIFLLYILQNIAKLKSPLELPLTPHGIRTMDHFSILGEKKMRWRDIIE